MQQGWRDAYIVELNYIRSVKRDLLSWTNSLKPFWRVSRKSRLFFKIILIDISHESWRAMKIDTDAITGEYKSKLKGLSSWSFYRNEIPFVIWETCITTFPKPCIILIRLLSHTDIKKKKKKSAEKRKNVPPRSSNAIHYRFSIN